MKFNQHPFDPFLVSSKLQPNFLRVFCEVFTPLAVLMRKRLLTRSSAILVSMVMSLTFSNLHLIVKCIRFSDFYNNCLFISFNFLLQQVHDRTVIVLSKVYLGYLTLFRMGLFLAAHRWGGPKTSPLLKICHTNLQ